MDGLSVTNYFALVATPEYIYIYIYYKMGRTLEAQMGNFAKST